MYKLIRSTIFFQGTGYLLQFGAFMIFAKILGAGTQGILSIFRASGQIVASLVWLGLVEGIVYFLGRDKDLFSSVIKNCLKLFIVVFPVLSVIAYIFPINKIMNLYFIVNYIPHLLIFIFFLSFCSLYQVCILSIKKYLHYNLITFGSGVTIFLFSVLISLLSEDYRKLNLAIDSYIITYGVMFIYGTLLITNEAKNLKETRKQQPFIEQLIVGFRGYISGIAALLLFRVDLFLVGYYLSVREVGVYSIALFSAELITKIPAWSASILTPMVASNEQGHLRKTVYLFYSSVILALILGIAFIIIASVFPGFISSLIGKDFKGVELCLLLLLPRVIMQSGVSIYAANLAGKGYPWYHPAGCILPLFILVALDVFLIPRWGIYGAALGNSIAFIGAAIVFWYGFNKYNQISDEISFRDYCNVLCNRVVGRSCY